LAAQAVAYLPILKDRKRWKSMIKENWMWNPGHRTQKEKAIGLLFLNFV
jgi:hypothetical protein